MATRPAWSASPAPAARVGRILRDDLIHVYWLAHPILACRWMVERQVALKHRDLLWIDPSGRPLPESWLSRRGAESTEEAALQSIRESLSAVHLPRSQDVVTDNRWRP